MSRLGRLESIQLLNISSFQQRLVPGPGIGGGGARAAERKLSTCSNADSDACSLLLLAETADLGLALGNVVRTAAERSFLTR